MYQSPQKPPSGEMRITYWHAGIPLLVLGSLAFGYALINIGSELALVAILLACGFFLVFGHFLNSVLPQWPAKPHFLVSFQTSNTFPFLSFLAIETLLKMTARANEGVRKSSLRRNG